MGHPIVTRQDVREAASVGEKEDLARTQTEAHSPSENKATERRQPASNVFSEFASSAWRSGVQRPVESLGQIVGLETKHVEIEDDVDGWMKVANVAGNATGQLIDMGLMTVGFGKLLKGVRAGMMARSLMVNGATGATYGGLLTPVAPGDSQWSRLGHATVEAGTFMALGAVHLELLSATKGGYLTQMTKGLGDSIKARSLKIGAGVTDRAAINFASGATAGMANTQLDAMVHGKLHATNEEYVNNAIGWAIGNVVLGEGIHQGRVATNSLVKAYKQRYPVRPIEDVQSGDAPVEAKSEVPPELDLRSLKEIAQTGDETRVRKLVELYYPALKKAFPLPGEIETPETYVKYLMDPKMKWEMEQLLGPIQGGLQYQILPVGGERIGKAGWLEHIWVAEHVREGGYGSALLKHVQGQVEKKGGDVTFWEWNNPDKMTAQQILEDAKGGITTQDRVNYWGKRGSYVAVVRSTGEIAPYSQPGMDGQEAVPYLSLAWSKPGGLEGQTISKKDYLKVLLSAHDTITDVKVDPTVSRYKAELEALPDQEFSFMKLKDYIRDRTRLLEEAKSPDNDLRVARWRGKDFTPEPPRKMFDIADAPANEEVAKAMRYQAASRSPWLRTADDVKRFPTLKGDAEADTVVVGSGVVGQQIAEKLASMGQKVLVLERGRVGSGTSSMMGAMNTFVPDTGFEVMAGSYGTHFPEIMRRSIAARNSSARLGRQFGDYQPVDSYNVGYMDNHPIIKAEAEIAQKFDPGIRFISGGSAERIFPPARSVAIFPREGNLNPRKLLLGMAQSGRYRVYEDSPVIGVSESRRGDGADVFTPEGVVHAKKVIFATNGPVRPFSYLNQFLTPVQTFSHVANVGRRMPGNYFDAPNVVGEEAPFSYWRQFNLPKFEPHETLVGGTAHFLNEGKAVPFEPELYNVTRRLFNAEGGKQNTALIFTSYADGVPIYSVHPEFPAMSIATGAGGTGLVGGGLLAQAAEMEARGKIDALLSPNRFNK